MGIKSVLIFIKAPDELKDNTGKEAWNPEWINAKKYQSDKRCRSGNGSDDRCCTRSLLFLRT